MIVIIVGLTIFLYTSYYANQTIQRLPSAQRLQMSSLISVSAALDDIDPFMQKTVIGSLANQNLVTNENGGESVGTYDGSNAVAVQSSNDQQTQQQNIGHNYSELSNSLNENNNNNNNENENSNISKNIRKNIDKSDSNKMMQQNSAGECIFIETKKQYYTFIISLIFGIRNLEKKKLKILCVCTLVYIFFVSTIRWLEYILRSTTTTIRGITVTIIIYRLIGIGRQNCS